MRRAFTSFIPSFIQGAAALSLVAACGSSGGSQSSGPEVRPIAHEDAGAAAPDAATEDSSTITTGHDAAAPEDASAARDASDASDAAEEVLPGMFACGDDLQCVQGAEYCIDDGVLSQCVAIPRGCASTDRCSCIDLSFGGGSFQCRLQSGNIVVAPR